MSYAAQARQILTSGLVDDAGLFPPERLAMGPALDRYRRNLAEADPVLSHRFVCPASRWTELRNHLAPMTRSRYRSFSIARCHRSRPIRG